MKVYAFDVDETLEVSGGPVLLQSLVDLVQAGHCVGICGNWAVVVQRLIGWQRLVSFLGPIGSTKADFLKMLRMYIPADEYVVVGNVPGVSGASDDVGAAKEAGWRFLRESEFAEGGR